MSPPEDLTEALHTVSPGCCPAPALHCSAPTLTLCLLCAAGPSPSPALSPAAAQPEGRNAMVYSFLSTNSFTKIDKEEESMLSFVLKN